MEFDRSECNRVKEIIFISIMQYHFWRRSLTSFDEFIEMEMNIAVSFFSSVNLNVDFPSHEPIFI